MAVLTDFIFTDVLIIFIIVLCLVYLHFNWAFFYWKRKGVEHTPASIPYGSASRLITQKTSFGCLFQEIYEKYKARNLRYVGFYLFSKPVLILLDINLIKTILTKDFQHFTDHGDYINEDLEPLTATLFALEGQKWKHLRTKLTPTFTSGKVKMMFQTLVECSNSLKEVMNEIVTRGDVVDIKDVAARYTTDVIGSCAFGLDCNSLKDPDSEFRKFGKQLFNVSGFEAFAKFLALVSPKLVSVLRLKLINQNISDFLMNFVKQTVEYREVNGIKRNDFMHLLIQLKNNVQLREDEDMESLKDESRPSVDGGLTIEQIAAQVLVFFVGGFETSSTTLAFCLFELVTNPEIQEKLRAEINTVLAKYKNDISYEAVLEMTYMDKCIHETLRKYPPMPILFRVCTEKYTIPESNVIVEKGTRVFIPVLGVQRDPEFYPNPKEFDPERFSANRKSERELFTWLPFGEGPRACIGSRFGLMQIKVALTALLHSYDFTLNKKTEMPIVMSAESIIMTAKGGIWLNAKKLK